MSDPIVEQTGIIKQILHNVNTKISFGNETLEQAGRLGVISHMLQALKDLENGPLKIYRDILHFDFTPPVDIPVHTEKAINTIVDAEFNESLRVIGDYIGQVMDQSVGKPATSRQLLESHVRGVVAFRPAVVGISNIGYMVFQALDEFDGGAVINGKSMNTVRGINISEAGQSFIWVRPEILRTPEMVNTLTLPEIDEWRIGRLKVIGSMSREAGFDKTALQSLLAGVRIDRIFK